MPDLDAMQLADVGDALEESVAKIGLLESDPPDFDYIVEEAKEAAAALEDASPDSVAAAVENAVEITRAESEENHDALVENDQRWLGEVLVRELAYRGFKIVRAG